MTKVIPIEEIDPKNHKPRALCRTCMHCAPIIDTPSVAEHYEGAKCTHQGMVLRYHDPVTGEYPTAKFVREQEHHACGPGGQNWKALPAPGPHPE